MKFSSEDRCYIWKIMFIIKHYWNYWKIKNYCYFEICLAHSENDSVESNKFLVGSTTELTYYTDSKMFG